MSVQVKLTKNAFRLEKQKLARLQMYLPTLKLKKALLQAEVQNAVREAEAYETACVEAYNRIYAFAELFSIPLYTNCVEKSFEIQSIDKDYENVAGVEVPIVRNIRVTPVSYSLLETPIWLDTMLSASKELVIGKIMAEVTKERQQILEEELRAVTIRVNLFEKKLIPETMKILKKISVFLSDRSITDVGQVKMAKKKIELRKIRGSECV
ncbi:V-type ATP synthase subunit D,V-type ATPase, D subunit,ATP synthase subunit D [Chlamydia serpentis]|uniref:V-type ATP synthase subunit D n=1 Tax=Chlamydia serpentis TaxID=1967782 RepID=A0A2R8FAG6_9CHLA|nr:V-type ATP synthase subunit D [Chlamydia serpentis]SPN73257.1 V-type ATP synthase subunit D,V-type ATPase, D subunit,ATP synthase subunit D [Chlamydia serpentis]